MPFLCLPITMCLIHKALLFLTTPIPTIKISHLSSFQTVFPPFSAMSDLRSPTGRRKVARVRQEGRGH